MLHWRGEGEVARGIRLRHFAEVSRSVDDVIDLMGSLMRYGRNMEIFGEDEPADYLYKVVRGTVRIAKLMSDGRRQINAFYLPGDIIGLDSLGAEHLFEDRVDRVARDLHLPPLLDVDAGRHAAAAHDALQRHRLIQRALRGIF